MNKIDFAKINKKEDMIMAFNQLKDDYSIAFQQIQELTNNWNELEKIVEKGMNSKNYIDGYESVIYEEIYDRMNEIKERKNENI